MEPVVERILENFTLGEGPHWDVSSKSLYFVDIWGKKIHRYQPDIKNHYEAEIDGLNAISFIIPVEGRGHDFVIGLDNGLAVITWDGLSPKVSKCEKLASLPDKQVRFNDGKADPSGRLWAGTMAKETPTGEIPPNKGSLYSFEKSQLKLQLEPVHISNGLAWNSSLKKMYYIDSGNRTVDQYDFDESTGSMGNRQVIFTFGKHNVPGFPDGQTIDSDGNLWVAVFSGSRIIKIDPRKPETLLETIQMPALQVTSVQFGGENLDELYVTTARMTQNGIDLEPPVHGALYRVTNTGSKGIPSNYFKFNKTN